MQLLPWWVVTSYKVVKLIVGVVREPWQQHEIESTVTKDEPKANMGQICRVFWACSPALHLWFWAHIHAWHRRLSCHAMQWTLPRMPSSEGRRLGAVNCGGTTGYTQPSDGTRTVWSWERKTLFSDHNSQQVKPQINVSLDCVMLQYFIIKKLLISVADLRFISIIIKGVWVWGEGSISNNFRNDPKHTFATLNCVFLYRGSQQF